MDSLTVGRVAEVLDRLHREAEAADRAYREEVMTEVAATGDSLEAFIAEKIAEEKADYTSTYRGHVERFLAV